MEKRFVTKKYMKNMGKDFVTYEYKKSRRNIYHY